MTNRRLIEDYLPVVEISYESSREKVARRRNGHLAMLHLWWARRPLAAARAAVYASLVDAPPSARRAALPEFFKELCHWTGPILPVTPALTHARNEIQAKAGGRRPLVLDPFGGGGAIPLEALRLGCDVVSNDLNPVAHLIQLACLDWPMRWGEDFARLVETWGGKIIDEAWQELGDLYADVPRSLVDSHFKFKATSNQTSLLADDGGDDEDGPISGAQPLAADKVRPIAWLWTRTVPSPSPGWQDAQVPLARQGWLRRKPGAFVAIKPEVDRVARMVRWHLLVSDEKREADAIKKWGFDPKGLSSRGSTTCPFTGATVTLEYIKSVGKERGLGAQLLAVAAVVPGRRGKVYMASADLPLPEDFDLRCATQAAAQAQGLGGLGFPDEPLPADDTRSFFTPPYGLDTYTKLYTPRQLATLMTLSAKVRAAEARVVAETNDPEKARAVTGCLALLVGRVADRGSTLCHWHNVGEKTENTYARQALPMVWDFAEANPFGGASGDVRSQLGYIVEVLEHCAQAADKHPARVTRGSAQGLALADNSVDAVVTDPPYYDNISYSDLSDFFYVWHRRAAGGAFPTLYATPLTPKKPEAVAVPQRHGGKKPAARDFYEAQMLASFKECHRVLKPEAPMVVVYAHKTTAGWATLVDAMRNAGFAVTEAWPLDTEMPDRVGQMQTASLATSIFLVARHREHGRVGEYLTEVRPRMQQIVANRVPDLMQAGIAGADLVIATVGAALEPFTACDEVQLPSGETLSSDAYLDEVQKEVLETVLAAVFQVDKAGVGQIDSASRLYVLWRYQWGEATVDFGDALVLAQALGIELGGASPLVQGRNHLCNVEKGQARLRTFDERGSEDKLAEPGEAGPASLVDALHRALWLLDHDRLSIGTMLQASRVDLGRLQTLAQSLSGRTLGPAGGAGRTAEQQVCERLLAQFRRLVEVKQMNLV